ncbi:ubiquitin carboxyl-terminal hydrolase 36 [Trichonephila clavata]|uniref:Ubiquitin carboxyl-terminal hydrolase 36 n=1 Tax=Trichonephila clavata TaxID=2740835 RepID=A0A8X6FSI7_TRICU|nr:ubiquitin carboxyl-terminal hydrolase 36 [Trichonephila clavata]
MMNSAIAKNINGNFVTDKDSLTQKIANGSRSSLLLGNIDFSVTEVKKPSTGTGIPGKYLCKIGGNETVCNGQKKQKSCVDQNRNTFNNSYVTLNGNKEKIEDGIPVPKVQLYTGKIHLEWKQIHKIGAGLNNLGNTCFMNTVIQCLTYCPPLANYLLHDNDHSLKCTVTGFCMMCVLQKHIKRAIGKTGDVIKPVDVYQRLKLIAKHFQFGRQEDAHEFLRYVIDNLWKSCLSQNNNCSKLDPASKETTVINRIFGGYHRSQVVCLRCKEKSNTFDHFMDFILDIKQNVLSLEKALEKFTQPEILEQENSYKCPKCKMKVTAQKKFTVYRAPNVATFQLKRFDYNRSFGGKITKQITYPEKLNLRPFMSDPKGDPVWYRLNAVLVHSGPSCNSGHYYCYVKNSNGFWYIMDDQRVHQVSLTQVLNQGAYVLFYIKAEPSPNPPMKKSAENRSPVIKGNNSACNYKKIPETPSIKSSPLTERNQAKQSSPTIKHQHCSSVNINKKPLSPNLNRERISFGIRTSMPNIQDIHKSEVIPLAKKVKQSQNISKASNNHTGLVPYMKDSSESSDENENSRCKVEINNSSLNNISDDTKLESAKHVKINKPVNENSPKIEVKRKISRSVLSISKISPTFSNSPIPTPSKVIATGSWTVTDAPVVSKCNGSSSSSNSVNSTTDWHVTSTNSDSSIDTVVNKSNCISKENVQVSSEEQSEYSALSSNNSVYCSSNLDTKSISCSNSQENGIDATSSNDDQNGLSNSKSTNKKCDFRKQQSQSENTFLDNDRNSKHQHNSFLKRKCDDSDTKISENSPEFHNNENRFNSLPKKVKYSEDLSKLSPKNGVSLHNKHLNTSEKYNSLGHEVKSESLHTSKSTGCDSSTLQKNKTVSPYCDKTFSKFEKSKEKRKTRETESVSSAGSSRSSLEYEWVEKTKDSMANNVSSSKEKYNRRNDYSSGSSSHSKGYRPHDVVSELTKNSNYFYGAPVPTWKGDSHYKDSSQSIYEKRKSLDDYEDERDRGKVRKFKSKDRYNRYYKQNPFQKYEERNYNAKYNGNSYYGHHNHHQRPYDSHYKWKQNRNHSYPRNKKYFKPHFRR